jgi:hypothetical protein
MNTNNNMKNILNKIFTTVLILQIIILNFAPVVSAQDVSPAPSPAVQEQTQPEEPSQQSTVSESPTPTTSAEPTAAPSQAPDESNAPLNPSTGSESNSAAAGPSQADIQKEIDTQSIEREKQIKDAWLIDHPQLAPYVSFSSSGGNVGNSSIATGNANNSATVINSANNNLASLPSSGGAGGSASVINSGNGSSSTNNGSATILNDNTTNQDNSASIDNGLKQSTVTGKNDSGFNVGNTDLATGDANTSGTVINAVNTNVDGVMVSEFNVADDHVGDLVLDFGANCVSGCGAGLLAANNGNGANSDNNANAQTTNNNSSTQNNNGTVGNELVLSADSGNNASSYNTGGDTAITTGDANVAGNALTFLNNNIAGNVVFSVVNIFGNLVGDIIFPDSQLSCCSNANVSATNNGNGANSDNNANASVNNDNATFQNNDATINNNLVLGATTGDNSTGYNTGGNSNVNSGQSNVDANVLNIANTNINGGNMWLVLINQAGNWIGKLVGSPDGANYAGSPGTEFSVGPNGEITASNAVGGDSSATSNVANGAGSTNTASASTTNTNTAVQTNTAAVNNTLRLNANTGGNNANFNTGGNSTITTGDANIIANLVNFVNNNIVGGGKLFVTIVNVFGSWKGDFIGPGHSKEVSKVSGVSASNAAAAGVSEAKGTTGNGNDGSNNAGNSKGITGLVSNLLNKSGGNENVSGGVTVSNNFSNNGNANAARTNNSSNLNGGLLASTKVLAMNTHTSGANNDGKIEINLAWLLLLLPVILLVMLVRKFRLGRDL